ncbi:hypothetical protein AVEN_190052-1 [Araneus ventricosus]|uniref:Uncharacterized protein n=1 Tax=Araneus ventricosus TaxID=182803 RepID=A0A4Y2MST3_ARAVE|nr:hypothetical protein AVEN_190052-1 [Araneus ventricosus]
MRQTARQSNLIKELVNNITNASRLEIDLMHDPATHAGLVQNMTHWQKELEPLKSEVISNITQSFKTPKNQSQKPFEFQSKRLTAKSITQLEKRKANPFVDTNKFQNIETDKDESPEIPTPPIIPTPPPGMLRKGENFTTDLKLIHDEFGEVKAKSGGIFIKFYTKTPKQHMKINQISDNQKS